jgi:hypothetical protein
VNAALLDLCLRFYGIAICMFDGPAGLLEFLIRVALLRRPRLGADPALAFGPPLSVRCEVTGLSPPILLQPFASLGPDGASFPALRVPLAFKLVLGRFFSRLAFFTHGRNGEEMKAKHGGKKKLACVFG